MWINQMILTIRVLTNYMSKYPLKCAYMLKYQMYPSMNDSRPGDDRPWLKVPKYIVCGICLYLYHQNRSPSKILYIYLALVLAVA